MLTNYDALVNADRAKVTNKMVSLFDRLQLKRDKESNLLALACAFILLAEAMKVPAQDAFQAAKNLMYDPLRHEGIGHGFAAMQEHLKVDY